MALQDVATLTFVNGPPERDCLEDYPKVYVYLDGIMLMIETHMPDARRRIGGVSDERAQQIASTLKQLFALDFVKVSPDNACRTTEIRGTKNLCPGFLGHLSALRLGAR